MTGMTTGERWRGAYEAYRARGHFSSLDGLRAISIIAVIWHHSSGGRGILGQGYHGVDLFFAISGFLITTLLLREHEKNGRIDMRAFYIRRALRILPLYYVVLGIYIFAWLVAFRGTQIGDDFFANLPAFVTYTTNWFVPLRPGHAILFFHAWSLATEEQFYLFLPPLLMMLLPYRSGMQAAATAIAALAISDIAITNLTDGQSFMRIAFTSIATPICGGALIAIALHSRVGFARIAPVLFHPLMPILAALSVGVVLWLTPGSSLLSVSLVLLVAACCIRDDHYLHPLLTSRPLAYIGRISYGMYLMHPLVIGVVAAALLGPAYSFLLTLAGTVGVARISYRYLESPLLRAKQRFVPSRTLASASSSEPSYR